MIAYDYPILGLFWTMLIFFLWVAWIIILFRVFVDIFRSGTWAASPRPCGRSSSCSCRSSACSSI